MSVGKFTSLEEVRRDPKLLPRFIRERIRAGHGEGNAKEIETALNSMIKSSPQDAQTSTRAHDEDCTETQTRRGTLKGA